MAKAGDLNFTCYTKPAHAQIGQNYILGKRQFLLNKNTTFNVDKMFKAMKFTETDRKIISILVAAHHDFGTLIKNTKHIQLTENNHTKLKPYLQTYKKKLEQYASVQTTKNLSIKGLLSSEYSFQQLMYMVHNHAPAKPHLL